MKQKRVGSYMLGRSEVELFAREGFGGEFFTAPEVGRLPRIKIGISSSAYRDVVACLLHECMEFSLDNMRKRFAIVTDLTNDSDRYSFMFHHSDLSEACDRVGVFMAVAIPDLCAVYKQWHKRKDKHVRK